MSTGISGSKTVLSMETMVSSPGRCGAGGGTSPSGVHAPWDGAAGGALFSLTGRGPFLRVSRQRGIEGVPRQGSALHTARKFVHARQGLQTLHLLNDGGAAIGADAAHRQLAELVGEFGSLGLRLAFHGLRHQRGARHGEDRKSVV